MAAFGLDRMNFPGYQPHHQLAAADTRKTDRRVEIHHLDQLTALRAKGFDGSLPVSPDNKHLMAFGSDQNLLSIQLHML